jgi:hypothetical protein
MAKTPSHTTQTTSVQLSPEQQWLFGLAKPGLEWWGTKTPERYPGSQIAGFDPSQMRGQNMALNAAERQNNLLGEASRTNNFLMGDIWNPDSNPYLKRAIGAATRPITENFEETVMPGIADEFIGAGQEFGGSRRGVAEGIAGGKYLDAIGDTSSKLVQDQYANNLNANVRALTLAPQTANALTTPAQTVSGVGDIRQKMDQALLNENVSNWNFDQNAPFLHAKELLSLIGGLPGGTATSSAPNQQTPWWQQALGIGSAGLGIGNALFPGMSAGIGSGIASLLAFI